MKELENMIVLCITELMHIYAITEYFKVFSEVRLDRRRYIYCVLAYICMLSVHMFPYIELLKLIESIVVVVLVSQMYIGKFRKKLLLSIMVYTIVMTIDLMVMCVLPETKGSRNYEIVCTIVSVVLLYEVIVCIRYVFKDKEKADISGPWYMLLVSAVLSIVALYIVYSQMTASQSAIIKLCVVMLAINIILYVFYMSMVDRFLSERENIKLKQQMNIYEQQIRSEVENNRKIRMIRHDMKHHIREISALLEKNRVQQAMEYLQQVNGEIMRAQNVYNTGNEAIDGILNYYAQRYIENSLELSVEITIPEKFDVNLYDINIILGNLLDNALENATRNTKVRLTVRYSAGRYISLCPIFMKEM